jgi:DNA-directed RNA polymerase specialized sigma24 family protein
MLDVRRILSDLQHIRYIYATVTYHFLRGENRMSTNPARTPRNIPFETAIVGILALVVDAREEHIRGSKEAEKTEALLASAGLSIEDIAALTNKTPNAVGKSIRRARAKN